MKKPIVQLAKVIRSKNCSPFELTLDIMFRRRADYEQVKEKHQISAAVIADLYHIPIERVHKVVFFDPACAVKICMARTVSSGAAGDSDVYGAQQHGPLLSLSIDI